MTYAAVIFLTLGVLVIGFGLLSLCNVLNLPFTDEQAEHANLVSPKFQTTNAKIMLLGATLIAIGIVLFWLAGA